MSNTHIQNLIALLNDDYSVAFIAKYRKEKTGSMTEEDIRKFIAERDEAKTDALRKASEEIANAKLIGDLRKLFGNR